MTVKLIKQMIDACRLGKRACDMMPPLPKDVLPSYIHVLDTVHTLEAAGALYARSGYETIAAYNDNPNATRWYGKAL